MTPSETLSYFASLAGPLIAAAGLITGVWWRMEGKVESVRKECSATTSELTKELNAFKLKVAEEYASWDTVRAIEARLTERMDSLSDQVMKMPDAIVERMLKFIQLNQPK
jgi:hypothetical protein